MKQTYKLHKWKKYMWVIFDEDRAPHGSGKEQDDFLPGLYPILDDVKNCSEIKRLDAEIAISNEHFPESDIRLLKVDDCRYEVTSDVTSIEYVFLTNRVKKYFSKYPKNIYLKIN